MRSRDDDSIVSIFDSVCFSHGDQDAIILPDSALCYLELQEYSKDLASQLLWRFQPTSYILVDARGHAAAEAVALLACMRIGIPFVPVSVEDQHAGDRLNAVVQKLVNNSIDTLASLCAIVCCQDDQDPVLGVFAKANIHRILFLDSEGNLRERLDVPSVLPEVPLNDGLYVLFTSGTTSNQPKAVVGSHTSTLRRLKWFRDTFEASPRIGRRTRLTFVDSITELFGGLLFPPSVLVAVDPVELRSEGISALMKQQVTQLTLLPSQLANQVLLLPDVSSLERVVVSGETCPASLIKKFRHRLPKATLINLYGQTETTGDVLYAVLTNMSACQGVVDSVVAVGRPIVPEVQVDLTDDDELVIRGNLSNGYLHASESFTSFPTGDVGFCRDGIWYVKGRKDERCKVLGIWTCPTEVEAALCQVFGIEHTCVAVIVNDKVYALVEGEGSVSFFSRESMKSVGVPWNLIPSKVFPHVIPRKSTGAGKVDRLRAKHIVRNLLSDGEASNPTENTGSVESIAAQVLKLSVSQVDLSRSFTELGGDSASAITLLYQLRQKELCAEGISATDILQTDSMEELRLLVLGRNCLYAPAKRRRAHSTRPVLAQSSSRTVHSTNHQSVDFAACVDASPLVYRETIYAGCQGGIVQRIGFDGVVIAHRQFTGWMIQAALIVAGGSLIVSASTRDGRRGLIAGLSLDLGNVRWSHQLSEGGIKVTPCLWKDKIWFCAGNAVRCCSQSNGALSQSIFELPWSTCSDPIVAGNTLVLPSSELDSPGLMTISSEESSVRKWYHPIGPVYKGIVTPRASSSGGTVVACDHYGSVHVFAILCDGTVQLLKSRQVVNNPLTSPSVPSNGKVVCGSYSGRVLCLDLSTLETLWTFNASAAVYTAPLVSSDSTIFVTTTGGDAIRLNMVNGVEIGRTRIPGEIWSNPSLMQDCRVAFGARDSRMHIVGFTNNQSI